ncbi:MAG: hypothetical protein IPK75_20620 [Acidobacteria bacterium]|nr:hypothetical protein [Acidobacteriota bacterium]
MVLADLAARFRAIGSTYCAGDTHESAYREGQRSVILWITEQMALDNDQVQQIVYGHVKDGEFFD